MDPISRQIFSYDYHRFVLQDLLKQAPLVEVQQQKKFNLYNTKESQTSKKDSDSNKKKENKKKPFDLL